MRSLESLLEQEQQQQQQRRQRQREAPMAVPACGAGGGLAEDGAPGGAAELELRPLTLDDFLSARAVVRPTRGRFHGVSHDTAAPSYDADLYD